MYNYIHVCCKHWRGIILCEIPSSISQPQQTEKWIIYGPLQLYKPMQDLIHRLFICCSPHKMASYISIDRLAMSDTGLAASSGKDNNSHEEDKDSPSEGRDTQTWTPAEEATVWQRQAWLLKFFGQGPFSSEWGLEGRMPGQPAQFVCKVQEQPVFQTKHSNRSNTSQEVETKERSKWHRTWCQPAPAHWVSTFIFSTTSTSFSSRTNPILLQQLEQHFQRSLGHGGGQWPPPGVCIYMYTVAKEHASSIDKWKGGRDWKASCVPIYDHRYIGKVFDLTRISSASSWVSSVKWTVLIDH